MRPRRSTGTTGTAAPARGTGTIQTAAFTFTNNANGTDTLTLRQMFDPAALQRALAQHDIPALVKTDASCASSPAPPDPSSIGVLSVRSPIKPHSGLVPAPNGPAPSALKQLVARTVTVINPAAIPSGTELFLDYSSSDHTLFTDLIYTSSYTCSTGQPPATP